MGKTGFWFLVEASDSSALEVAKYLHRVRVNLEPGIATTLDAWRRSPDGRLTDGPMGPSTSDFLDMFWKATVPDELFYACSDPRLDDATWDLATAKGDKPCKAVLAAIPSIAPAALLLSGLGPHRSDMLPGWLGMFSLTNQEVDAASEAIWKAHTLAPQRRFDALQRMHALIDSAGGGIYPIAALLDALPSALGAALADGTGLIAVSAVM